MPGAKILAVPHNFITCVCVCIFVGAGFIIYARLPRQQSHSLPMFCSRASILDTDLPAGTCDIVPTL